MKSFKCILSSMLLVAVLSITAFAKQGTISTTKTGTISTTKTGTISTTTAGTISTTRTGTISTTSTTIPSIRNWLIDRAGTELLLSLLTLW